MFYLTFRSLTQFDSTFYMIWDKVILIMMMMMVIMIMIINKGSIGTSCSNINYQKECLFHHQIALESLSKAYMCASISWLFCSIDQFVYIYADTTLFWLWHHYYKSCNKVVKVFQNVSLLKVVWAILSSLDFFNVNFRIRLSVSIKNCCDLCHECFIVFNVQILHIFCQVYP